MKDYEMAWRNVLRNKRRSAISALAIGIAAMSIVLLFSFISGFLVEMKENLQRYYFGEIRLRHSEFDKNAKLSPLHLSVENADDLLADLKQQDVFTAVGGRIQFPAAVYIEGEDIGMALTGLQFGSDPMGVKDYLVEGRLPQASEREVVLGRRAVANLGVGVGDKFTAITTTLRRASNGMTFTVVGIVDFPLNDLDSMAYLPLDTAQRFLKMGDRVVDVVLRTANGVKLTEAVQTGTEVLAGHQNNEMNAGIGVTAWNKIPSAFQIIQIAQLIYYIMGMIFYLLAATIIVNTIMMIIFERTKEIGTLASLGMEGKSIVRMFFLEALFISIIGSSVGVIIGSVFTLILAQTGLDFTQALGEIDFQISGIMYPKLTVPNIVIALVSGIVVAAGISLLPSRRAAKIKPVEAINSV